MSWAVQLCHGAATSTGTTYTLNSRAVGAFWSSPRKPPLVRHSRVVTCRWKISQSLLLTTTKQKKKKKHFKKGNFALYRALHDDRPIFWCWRVLANSATVKAGFRLISFISFRKRENNQTPGGLFLAVHRESIGVHGRRLAGQLKRRNFLCIRRYGGL